MTKLSDLFDPSKTKITLVFETEGKPTREYVFPNVVDAQFEVMLHLSRRDLDTRFELVPSPTGASVSLSFEARRAEADLYTLKVGSVESAASDE